MISNKEFANNVVNAIKEAKDFGWQDVSVNFGDKDTEEVEKVIKELVIPRLDDTIYKIRIKEDLGYVIITW